MELTTADQLAKQERIIAKNEISVVNYLAAFKVIRDKKLYEAAGFDSFNKYCSERWGKSVRAVQLAFQVDEVRASIAQSSARILTPEAEALTQGVSANVITELAKVEPEKRLEVLESAAKKTGGKVTRKAVKEAAAREAHKPLPPRGGFAAYTDAPVNTSAYTSAPEKEVTIGTGTVMGIYGTVTVAASFGGDEDAEDVPVPVTDARTAIKRLEQTYEAHKEWMNAVPPRMPRQILDRLIEGMRL